MAQWFPITDTFTSGGNPTQFFTGEGEVFICAYARQGGGNDETMPRRVIGIGATRDESHAAASRAVSRYDRMGRIVSRR